MPNIPIYTSRATIAGPENRPNATAAGMGGNIGAALEQAGHTLGQIGDVIYQRAEQREISKLNAATTQAGADLSNDLTTELKNVDPNDDEFATRFNDKVKDKIGQLSGMATTRGAKAYLERTSAQLQAHFRTRAFEGQTQLAGLAAQNNYMESLNAASSMLTTDPSSLEYIIQHQDETLTAMTPQIGQEQVLKLRAHSHNEAAKAAALGEINSNPTVGLQKLEAGDFDKWMDGTTKATLIGHAKTAIKAEEVDARLAAEEARRAKKDAADATMGQWLGQLTGNDPQQEKLTAKDVLTDPNTTHEDKEHFLRLLGVIGEGGQRKTDPQVMSDALHRAYLPPNDPNALTEDEIKRGAGTVYRSAEEINQLFTAVQQRKTTEGRQENDGFNALEAFAKKNLGGSSLGIPDPAGDALVADFMFKAKGLYDQQRKAGKTTEQLLSATSPDYLGRYLQVPTAKERSMRYVSAFKGGQVDISTTPTLQENLPAYSPEEAAKLPPGTRFMGTDGTGPYTKQ